MIDNFLGLIQRGDTGHYRFCHRMRHAVMIFFAMMIFFSFFKGQVKSPILHNTGNGSEFYVT